MTSIALLLVSFGVCVLSTRGAIALAHWLTIYDLPDSRKIHTRPVPYLGGVGLFIAMALMTAVLPWFYPLVFEEVRFLQVLVLTAALVVAFGVWDDVRGSGAAAKLTLEALAALLMFRAGVRIDQVAIPGGTAVTLGAAAPVLSVLWYVLLMNAVNLIDGLDGLAAGISGIGALFIVAFGVAFGDGLALILALILAGLCAGFLVFNFYPARVFMGDSGSLLLGFVLATITMMSRTKSPTLIVMLVPLIALGIPVFDSAFAFVRRVFTGTHPFRADQRHLHHRLMGLGLSHKRVVLTLYYISLYLGVMAFILSSTDQWIILLTAVLLGSGLVLLVENISFLERRRAAGQESQHHPQHPDSR
ncbi:MAG: MraY family glycosyltransferase [Candidatus Sumerlaeia bacterium]